MICSQCPFYNHHNGTCGLDDEECDQLEACRNISELNDTIVDWQIDK
jgi:hypothetical protein